MIRTNRPLIVGFRRQVKPVFAWNVSGCRKEGEVRWIGNSCLGRSLYAGGGARGSEYKYMPTEFQNRVYDAARRIPRGSVVTYKALALAVNCRAAQAVGQALRRNPYAPEVPCHRVVASDRSLGGFNGERAGEAIARKIALLKSEGVRFDDDGCVNAGAVLAWLPGGKRG